MSCISANDMQLARLADAIAQRVGQQRFHVWFNNSTRLDLSLVFLVREIRQTLFFEKKKKRDQKVRNPLGACPVSRQNCVVRCGAHVMDQAR